MASVLQKINSKGLRNFGNPAAQLELQVLIRNWKIESSHNYKWI